MSLILDALRKIELERKARRHGGGELRPDVLSYRGTPQKTYRTGRLLLVAVSLLLLAGVVAAVFLRSEKAPPVTSAPPAVPDRTAAAEKPPLSSTYPQPLQELPATTRPDIGSQNSQPRAVLHDGGHEAGGGAEEIKVSGIAWQEERLLRRAVINGALLSEGAEVMGARILEIKENRVKFSRSGQIFEVLYPSVGSR